MFILWLSYEGLKVTCYSTIEATKFLLSEREIEYVLPICFVQDNIEDTFGAQMMGGYNENPDVVRFGYNNNNSIQIQRYTSSSGNTRGSYDKRKTWENITDDKVPKRKK